MFYQGKTIDKAPHSHQNTVLHDRLLTLFQKVVNLSSTLEECKSMGEIKHTALELQSTLLTLQSENMTILDILSSQTLEINLLHNILTDIDSFTQNANRFLLKKMPSGSMVYIDKSNKKGDTTIQYACLQCFNNHEISLYQPTGKHMATPQGPCVENLCQRCLSTIFIPESG